jgi:hypothetical protein
MNILDLEPAAFAAALDELGLVGEQRDALIAQYSDPSRGYQRDERPFLTRLADNVIGFDDGVETQGERIGQSVGTFFDAVREDPLGVAGDMASGLYGQVERGVQGELSPFETFELAGILALPAAGARFDPTVARMFGGRGTTNEYADRAMDRAEELRDQGLSPEDIWRTTAEEFPDAPATVLPDGRPFYEMPDAEALTQSLAQERAQTLIDQALQATDPEERALLMGESRRLLDEQPAAAGVLSTPLVDVMSHPQLYQDFPRVGDIKTQMAASLPSNTAGQYYPPPSTSTAGVAQVSSRYRNQPQSQAEVLLHETQHGVAGVTKEIPQGTNPDTIRSFTAELENRAGSYRTNARTESDNLMDRMDNMESYFANEGPEALRVYEQIVDPLIGQIWMATDAASAPYDTLLNRLYGTGGTSRTVTQGSSSPDPAHALYRLNPGEALARLTESRRDMSMAERRATTPMETLRQESRPIEWDELAEIRSPGDLESYLQDNFDVNLDIPEVDGVPYYDYFRALNSTVSNSQRVINETVNALSGVTDDETRRRIIAEGRDRVRNRLQDEVKKYAQ